VEIPASARRAVYARDNRQCQACGISIASGWYSVQHRHARGTGGANALSNLVLLCGSAVTGCHGKCEKRDFRMRERGFWVNSWDDPSDIPILTWDSRLVFLANDGTWSFTKEEREDELEKEQFQPDQ
jgi:hypothetical protein